MQVSQDEEAGEETLPRVIFVYIPKHECKDFVIPIAEYLESVCKVEKFCISWECRAEFSLLFKSTPSDENVLLVFMPDADLYYTQEPDWIAEYSCLFKIRPDLRRVIFSPYPLEPDEEMMRLHRYVARMERFNNRLEEFCAEKVTNYRILHPDSDSVNCTSDWEYSKEHYKLKLAQTIYDIVTNPKAKFENYVESSHTYEVRTSTVCYSKFIL
jgi:hypothetical protein